MVKVAHLPEAFLGLRPLGFFPLTAPLPRTYYWLRLFNWFSLRAIQGWWIPATISRTCFSIKPIKECSVKVETSRTLSLSEHYFYIWIHNKKPTIWKDINRVIHHRQRTGDEKPFFCRVFLLLQNFVVGVQVVSPYETLCETNFCRVYGMCLAIAGC